MWFVLFAPFFSVLCSALRTRWVRLEPSWELWTGSEPETHTSGVTHLHPDPVELNLWVNFLFFFFFNASWVISWFTLKLLRALKNSGLKPGWLFCFLQSRVLGKVVSCRHVPLAALSRHSVGAATSHTLSVTNHLRERATCFKRGMMAVRGRSSWSAGSVWHLLRSWHGWVGSLNQHALCFSIVCFRSGIIKHQSKLYCCGYRKIRTLSRTSGSNKFVLYLISYLSQCQYETTSFYYINCI